MTHPVLPTIDGPIEAWCEFCRNRDLPPDLSYCSECLPALRRYRESIDRRPGRRLLRMLAHSTDVPVPTVPRPVPPAREK